MFDAQAAKHGSRFARLVAPVPHATSAASIVLSQSQNGALPPPPPHSDRVERDNDAALVMSSTCNCCLLFRLVRSRFIVPCLSVIA
jgi:hypothetical protein